MNISSLTKERKRRVESIIKELGMQVQNVNVFEGGLSASILKSKKLVAHFKIEDDFKFLELSYGFIIPEILYEQFRHILPELMECCYENGVYFHVNHQENSYNFAIFTKVYYSGLNYYSFRDTLGDMKRAIKSLTDTLSGSEEE